MKGTGSNKWNARLMLLALLIAVAVVFAGCSVRSKLVGEYFGEQDSYLNLRKDGTCLYAEDDSTGIGTGTWYVANGVIYINVDNLDYTIYGDVSGFDEGMLLEADSGSWNEEHFEKID